MVQDILWKIIGYPACQTPSCFLYGNVFTKSRHWTVSWSSRIQFARSIPISLRSILMLSFHLLLVLPIGLFTFGPPNWDPVIISPLPHACPMFHQPHPPWFNHLNNIRWRIQTMKFIIMQFSLWCVLLPFMCKYPPHHSVLRTIRLYSCVKLEYQPLSSVRDFLWISYSHLLSISGGPLLNSRPEDAPCPGDKGPT